MISVTHFCCCYRYFSIHFPHLHINLFFFVPLITTFTSFTRISLQILPSTVTFLHHLFPVYSIQCVSYNFYCHFYSLLFIPLCFHTVSLLVLSMAILLAHRGQGRQVRQPNIGLSLVSFPCASTQWELVRYLNAVPCMFSHL
jgi:hypothetical protein